MKQSPIHYSAYYQQVNRYLYRYEQVAALYHEVADRLLDRLELMRFTPEFIVDVGSKDGYSIASLLQRYPQSMIHAIEDQSAWFDVFSSAYACTNIQTHTSDIEHLPLDNQSTDCIFSNLAVSRSNDFEATLGEWLRVLKPEGMILFSCLGVDTLKEYRQSMQTIGCLSAVHDYTDMHWVGDVLIAQGYIDPVVHMETLTIHYGTLDALWRDLRYAMAANARVDRSRGLLTPKLWKAMLAHYASLRDDRGRYPVTFEIIYGHALAPKTPSDNQSPEMTEHVFSVDQIKVRSNNQE
ncbi:MAG: hypothetical protein CL816_08225 [Coxiellaceae bacterium]|nr:hypothetical protein [Coxiellaceae bacterium]|tara:strand:- start:5769 stop:6653 length:885 start_codon:yes stop_codon:yes gene_type:complete